MNRQMILDACLQVDDISPSEQICNITADKEMFSFLILMDNQGNKVSDLTGRFPIQIYAGMNYIFVCYAYKLNTILL